MMYEVRVRDWLGNGSSSLGFYYKNESNAQKLCDELNELLPVYYVASIKFEDEEETL